MAICFEAQEAAPKHVGVEFGIGVYAKKVWWMPTLWVHLPFFWFSVSIERSGT